MSDELIVLVNDLDQEIGFGEKMDIHRSGRLHRAFSLFILDRTNSKLLLQQRAQNKYHSGRLWTNSCCSHQRANDDLESNVRRRVLEELGFDISDRKAYTLCEHGKFRYYKDYGMLTEHEIDHIYTLKMENEISFVPDGDEIAHLKWIDLVELQNWMLKEPEAFTAWFYPALNILLKKKILTLRSGDVLSSQFKDLLNRKICEVCC